MGCDASNPTTFSAEPAMCYQYTRMTPTGIDIERTHCPDCGVEKPPGQDSERISMAVV
jgi:hypothetical protein